MTPSIGVLTGGGTVPDSTLRIRAVVRSGISKEYQVIGIRNGWLGLISDDTIPLTDHSVSGIISRGGRSWGRPVQTR